MPDLTNSSKELGFWPHLSDLNVTPLGGIGDIEISEVTGDVEEGEAVFRTNAGSAARMLFAVDADITQDASSVQALTKSLLGGWWQGSKRTPLEHPYYSGLFATDVSIKNMAMSAGNTLGGDGLNQTYQRAILNVEFRSLPYTVNAENGNWMQFTRYASNQRVASPQGTYVYDGGPDDTKTAAPSVYYTVGISYIAIKIHQVSHDTLYPAGALKSIVDQYVGLINSAGVGDYPIDTLLLDSVDVSDNWGDYAQDAATDSRMYAPTLNLIFAPNGWNKVRDSTGAWNKVKTANGGNPPFSEIDLNAVIRDLEPSWE